MECVAAEELIEYIYDAEAFQTIKLACAVDILGPKKFRHFPI